MTTRITGYPDFQRLPDRDLVQQLKLIWDAIKGISADVAAVPLADIVALQKQVTALQTSVTSLTVQTTTSSWAITSLTAALAALDVLTTKGDLLSRTSSAYTRLGVGTSYQFLVPDSAQASGLKWWTPPGAGLKFAANSTIATGAAWQKILLDTAVEDNDGICDTVNSKLICRTAGIYTVNFNLVFGGEDADNIRVVGAYLNGVELARAGGPANSTYAVAYPGVRDNVRLAVNDYIELYAFQNSGSSLTVYAFGTYLNIRWVRP